MTPCLYERLTGDAWVSLSPAIKAVHLQEEILEAAGTFEITYGRNPLARLINTLTGMPRAAPSQSIQLTIRKSGDGEEWVRQFGESRLASVQEGLPGAILAERFGLLELTFMLTTPDGGILYHQLSASLNLGKLRLKLPRWAAPRVDAAESVGEADKAHISVRVSLPLIGHQLSYGGELSRVSAQ
jgi:uncharacterized protein DUF4166